MLTSFTRIFAGLFQLLLLVGLQLWATIGQGQSLAPITTKFERSQWGNPAKVAVVFPNIACGNLKKVTIQVRLDNGADHASGTQVAFTTQQEIVTTVSSTGGAQTPSAFRTTLKISQSQPEQWRVIDVPARFLGTNSASQDITVTISVPNLPTITGTDPGTQRAVVVCVPEYETYAPPTQLTVVASPVNVSTGFDQTLQWTSACGIVPNFQVQLYHRPKKVARNNASLTSTNPSYNDQTVPTDAEWNDGGVLLETGSPALQYKLALADGEGTYHWRVRAIGSQPGGVTSPDNWGPWSSAQHFDVTAPNAGSNWIYSRTFTEGGRVAETLSYANGLQHLRQTQTRTAGLTLANPLANQQVVASQVVQDYVGRDALTSLPIPILGDNQLGYKPLLLAGAPGNIPYSAAHFDLTDKVTPANSTARKPGKAREKGYYSTVPLSTSTGDNERVPSSEGFPFTRTVFTNDGTNRVQEQGGAGRALRVHPDSIGEPVRTVRTAFASVAPQELLRLFGKEAPEADNSYKTIITDPNNTSSITYQTKEGKTIATALSAATGGGANSLLDEVPASAAEQPFEIKEHITSNGSNNVLISKTLVFTEPTEIEVEYNFTVNDIYNSCANYCTTCDYQVRVRIVKMDGDASDPPQELTPLLILASDQCTEVDVAYTHPKLTLNAGTYRIEREIVPFNYYPVPTNALAFGPSSVGRTLAEHLENVREAYEILSNRAPWPAINAYIASNDVAGLYSFLAQRNYPQVVNNNQNCYAIPAAGDSPPSQCTAATVYLPILTDYCGAPCTINQTDFEQELLAKITELNAQYPNNQQSFTTALPGYSSGQFNTLVQEMINASLPGGTTAMYSCEQLRNCWTAQLSSLESKLYINSGTTQNTNTNQFQYQYHLAKEFLQCTGVDMTMPVALPATVAVTESFTKFSYDPNNAAHIRCLKLLALPATAQPTTANLNTINLQTQVLDVFTSFTKAARNRAYNCIVNSSVATPSNVNSQAEAESAAALLTSQCEQTCESRRSDFFRTIVMQMHQQGKYIEGDVYTWVPGANGIPTQAEDAILANTPLIPLCEVYSLTQEMVEQCQNDCFIEAQPVYEAGTNALVGYTVGTNDQIISMRRAMFSRLYVHVKDDLLTPCPTDAVWAPVPKSLTSPNLAGLTANARTIIGSVKMLTQGANQTVGLAGRTNLLGCSSNFNALSEKVLNIFSLTTILPNSLFPFASCANNSRPNYVTLEDARVFRPTTSPNYNKDSDYLMVLGSSETNGISNPHVANAPGSCFANDVPTSTDYVCGNLCSIDGFYGPHFDSQTYFFRFANAATGQPINKNQILAISDPFLSPQATNPASGSFNNTSEGVRVRVLMFSSGFMLPIWRLAQVITFSENMMDPAPTGQDQVMSWKKLEIDCPATTSNLQLCYRWSATPDTITPPANGFAGPTPCNVVAATRIRNSIDEQRGQWVDDQVADFRQQFENKCVRLNSLMEELYVTYKLGYKHFTLYYYDRSGNLIKTIPPAGVAPFSTTQVTSMMAQPRASRPVPAHTLPTTYSYNSLHQLVGQTSPDGGQTKFYYNLLGQLRFSQNAQQALTGKYSYTRYDALGRIVEIGESTQGVVNNSLATVIKQLNDANYPTLSRRQVTRTVYSDAAAVTYPPTGAAQTYLTNRVSYSYLDVDGNPSTTADNSYTYYSYDPHGNVEWLAQEQTGLGRKFIRYDYDLISNKVLQVNYQQGQADQFYHRYTYDADNRLTEVYTSSDGNIWDQDARYLYYAHGPLKRMELGEDHVQGVDYTYTIQGWLKGINHPTSDPGHDGEGITNTSSGKDAFGMALGYFPQDFKTAPGAWATTGVMEPTLGLFNGNIASWTTWNDKPTGTMPVTAEAFRYDQLNRLVSSNFSAYTNSAFAAVNDYSTAYTYDPNGNIKTLNRNTGSTATGNAALTTNNDYLIDKLTYAYIGNNNQLLRVDDGVSAAATAGFEDVKPATVTTQYTYDKIGNLTSDITNNVTAIDWTVYGKINKVSKGNGDIVTYTYDAAGNRILKAISTSNGALVQRTYYVRDAVGNIMATYEQQVNNQTAGAITLREHSLYGNSRLGVRRPFTGAAQATGYYARNVGQKQYELVDQLENVRAVVTDVKQPSTNGTYKGSLETYYNYYAFGMLQQGRSGAGNATNSGGYRYGYNGKEKDNNGELGLTNYDYGFRIYNPAIAKFLSVDPLTREYPMLTPYQFASNRPIDAVDLDGKEAENIKSRFIVKHQGVAALPIINVNHGWGNIVKASYTLRVHGTAESFNRLKETYATNPGIIHNPNNIYATYYPLEDPKDKDNYLAVGDHMYIDIFGPFNDYVRFTGVNLSSNSFEIKAATLLGHTDAGTIQFSGSFDPKSGMITFTIKNETTLNLGIDVTSSGRYPQGNQWRRVLDNAEEFLGGETESKMLNSETRNQKGGNWLTKSVDFLMTRKENLITGESSGTLEVNGEKMELAPEK
jgi:RHS repeat-associated protein